MNIKKVLIVCNFLSVALLFSNNLDNLNTALDKLKYDKNKFSYENLGKDIGNKKEVETVSLFNPKSEPKLNLISVDGHTPTKKEIKDFYKKGERGASDKSFYESIVGDNYTLISTVNGVSSYSYTTINDFMDDYSSKMYGEIWIDNETLRVVKIKLKNIDKISFAPGVNMNKFEIEFDLSTYNKEFSVVSSFVNIVELKVLLKSFSSKSINTIYNYELVN